MRATKLLSHCKQWIPFALLAPTTCLAAYHLGSLAAVHWVKPPEQQRPPVAVNGLYIEPKSLDLGKAWETPRYTFHLAVQNVSSATRTITRFQTTCGCLELEPPGQTIAPGDTAKFTAHLDLTHRMTYQFGVSEWPTSVRIDPVFAGDFAPTPGWEVKATVRSRVTINTLKLVFEDGCSHGGTRVWRKVRAKAHVPLKTLQASVRPKSAEVRIESNAANPGDFCIFVSPNPSLPVGRFHLDVQLQAVMPDGKIYPCSAIEVVGEMQPSTQVTPRLVLLGEHKIPSEAEADVTLRLPANDWKIDHIETDSTDTFVTQTKDEFEEGVRLHITQRIRQSGDRVSIIRIVVRKPDKQVEMVPVEVRYYGQNAPSDSR